MTGHLDEAARLLRDAETDQYTARARWMLDLARTHAAIAQAEATARVADQLAYRRAEAACEPPGGAAHQAMD